MRLLEKGHTVGTFIISTLCPHCINAQQILNNDLASVFLFYPTSYTGQSILYCTDQRLSWTGPSDWTTELHYWKYGGLLLFLSSPDHDHLPTSNAIQMKNCRKWKLWVFWRKWITDVPSFLLTDDDNTNTPTRSLRETHTGLTGAVINSGMSRMNGCPGNR